MKQDLATKDASERKSNGWRLLILFLEMCRLSAFVLGGGYVILSVADERFSRKRWIRKGELFEALPLFQMIPGIIGGHTAVYLGKRVAGGLGAAVALAGVVLPSIVIFLVVSITYRSIPVDSPLMGALFLGLRAALTGTIFEIVIRQWRKSIVGFYGYAAFALGLAALVFGVSPGCVILSGMCTGVLIALSCRGSGKKSDAAAPRVYRSVSLIPILFFVYGLMAFGGGFVLVPVYLRDFVGASAPYLRLLPSDFANVMAMTQMTPGPVAVNCATFFGYSLGGVTGAFVATFALLLPGSLILFLALRSLGRFGSNVVVRGVFLGVKPITMSLMTSAALAFSGMSVWSVSAGDGALSVSPLGTVLAVGTLVAVGSRRLGAVKAILLSALLAFLCGLFVPWIL